MTKTSLVAALLAFAVLLVPTASAAPLPDAPDTLAQTAGDGLVHVSYALDPDVVPGDVLPLCGDAPEVPQNRSLLGTVADDCFQPYRQTLAPGGPIHICDPIIINLFPVGVAPDEECIENLGEWVQRIISGEGWPVHVGIYIQKK